MRSSAPLLLAFVVVLVASSGYSGIQARPLKYDALQRSTSRAARLYVSNTSAGLLGAESVDHSVSMHLQSDEDLLDQVAYRNPERWLVKVKRDGSSNCSEIISRICSELPASQTHTAFNGRCLWEASSLCFFTLEASSEHDLDTLLLDYEEHIDFAERDMKVIMEQSSGCAYPFPQTNAPWHLDRIDSSSMEQPLDNLFETPEDIFGEDVHIYILDTGIRDTHVEFAGRIGTGVNVLAGGSGSNFDDNGHGTAVASIAAGSTLGVCKCCKVHGIKCLDANGDGSYTDVVSALYWVLNNAQKPAIASLSLSGPTSQAINSVIHELYLNNILTIAAAGNENIDACTRSPGSSSYAVTVGASDRGEGNQDIRSGFSNYGSCVDLYAPGSEVQSAHFSGDQASSMRSGTSFSAPAVAGAAALYLQSYPGSSAFLW
jgi:subtilisin family serine protease